MNLYILTEAEEKQIDRKKLEYTSKDVVQLACLSSAITSLIQAMIVFHMNKDGQEVDSGYCDDSIFSILELLIKPIDRFLGEGAPMCKEGSE